MSYSLLDLDLLRTFYYVASKGEMQKAAEKVYRSKAAVSMQLKRLEEQLETKLLERSNKGITLTEEGEILLSYTEQLLRLNSAAVNAVKKRQVKGKISFGIPTDYAQQFLTKFMPILIQKFPDLEPTIICERSRNLRKMVNKGEIDIAIVASEGDPNEQRLWSERMCWVAPISMNLHTLSEWPIALFEGDCIIRDAALEDLKTASKPVKMVMKSPVMENLSSAVQSGIAMSLLPQSLITQTSCSTIPDIIGGDKELSMNMIHSYDFDQRVLNDITNAMKASASILFQ